MTVEALLDRLEEVRPSGTGWQARCPAHDDRTPSLSVVEGDEGILLRCFAGCATDDVVSALGLDWSDLFYEDAQGPRKEPEAIYDYEGPYGQLLFQVLRYPGKRFLQRTLVATTEEGIPIWRWGTEESERVLYRWPEWIGSEGLYLVEGEKDADVLREHEVYATCNPGGSGKWLPQYTQALKDMHIIIVADRDDAGRAHAQTVYEALQGVAREVEVVQAKSGKDAADHLAAGYTVQDFVPIRYDEEYRLWLPA